MNAKKVPEQTHLSGLALSGKRFAEKADPNRPTVSGIYEAVT
jgi:hypothetical protein